MELVTCLSAPSGHLCVGQTTEVSQRLSAWNFPVTPMESLKA